MREECADPLSGFIDIPFHFPSVLHIIAFLPFRITKQQSVSIFVQFTSHTPYPCLICPFPITLLFAWERRQQKEDIRFLGPPPNKRNNRFPASLFDALSSYL